MNAVKVAQRAVVLASEDRDCRVLTAFAIFAAEIVLESAFAGAQQTQSVPTAVPRVCPERCQIGSGDNRDVDVLREMMGNSVEGVEPRSAQRTNSDRRAY